MSRFSLKWQYLYYGLAVLDLFAVVASLLLNHHLSEKYSEVVKTNQVWTARYEQLARITELASAVNAPGNDVFDGHDVSHQKFRLSDSLHHYQSELASFISEISRLDGNPSQKKLVNQVEKIQLHMDAMLQEAYTIFAFLEKNDSRNAGKRMATMDRKYALLLSSFSQAAAVMREIQREYFAEQHVQGQSIRTVETILSFSVFIMLLGAVVYGRGMSRFVKVSEKTDAQLSRVINSSAIVALTDVRGRITFTNEKFSEISGYSKEELVGQDHRLLNSGYHPKEFMQELWSTISQGKTWHGEIRNKKKDGSFYWVDTTISPLFNSKGEIEEFMAIRFDVTDKKVSEEKLIESAKMASLGVMAGGVAHEINNPLAVIQGKASQLIRASQKGSLSSEQAIGHLEKIVGMCQRISRIVSGLRSFSRNADRDPLANADLQKIVADTIELCSERFKHHEVDLQIGPIPSLELSCRATQLSQVLLNLLSNALDAVDTLPEKWVKVEFNHFLGGEKVQIIVTDSGEGISEEVAKKMMEPFFTTKETGKGTGLGLSISRRIIEEHGGQLWLDRTCRHTRFVIEVPFVRETSCKAAA